MTNELPPLPKSEATLWHPFKYTADQIQEYARTAIAAADEALQLARGALADIAFSDDMTLSVARKKAARIYEATGDEPTS